ncbi:MAG: hypothetical protein QM820_39950 [Minicystis sp.]
MASRLLSPASVLLVAAALSSCGDPAKDAAVEELGPEDPGVLEGPLHRPGQPCLACHDGERARIFSTAGTVFVTQEDKQPMPGVSVKLTDKDGKTFDAVTNCAGNFFVNPEDFTPRFPLWVSLRVGSLDIAMDSPMNGDGSCAHCHGMTLGPTSTGRVYAFPLPPDPPMKGCQ